VLKFTFQTAFKVLRGIKNKGSNYIGISQRNGALQPLAVFRIFSLQNNPAVRSGIRVFPGGCSRRFSGGLSGNIANKLKRIAYTNIPFYHKRLFCFGCRYTPIDLPCGISCEGLRAHPQPIREQGLILETIVPVPR
jgi:hypothetical protein